LNAQISTNVPLPASRYSSDFWGNFSAASLRNLGGHDTPASDGSSSSAVGLNNGFVAARYKVSAGNSVGLVQNLTSTPLESKVASLGDAAVSLKNDSLFQRGAFNISSEELVYAPTSDSSRTASEVVAVRGVLTLNYNVPHSRVSIGSYSFAHGASYSNASQAATAGSDEVFVYQAPYANYKLARNSALSLWVDLIQMHKKIHERGVSFDNMAVKPGYSWDVNSKVNLNPYVSFYPKNFIAATTYVGMFVSLRM
jgi:hypothetical protein